MKTKFTEAQLEEISKLQAHDGITRKSAIRKYQRLQKLADKATKNVADLKKVAEQKTKKAAPKVDRTDAGSARAEGLRLYKLSGRPKKSDFIHVYGKPGVAWTWEARAKAVGLASAEEAAEKFQAMLQKPAKSCLVEIQKAEKSAAVGQ